MGAKNRAKKRDMLQKKILKEKIYTAVFLILIVSVVPLFVFLKETNFSDPGNLFWDGINIHYDIFSYYKMVIFLFLSAAAVLIFMFVNKENPFDRQKAVYYIPVLVYVFFVFLSAIFSQYKQVALFGYLERYEGMFVLVGYSVIMLLAMNVLDEEKCVNTLFKFLLVSAAAISIIGILQLVGFDYFESDFVKKIIIPPSLRNISLESRFPPRTIFSTLYNSNYVGSYMAMLLPIIAVLIVYTKNLIKKSLLIILLSAVLINWIGCGSRAGIIGGIFSMLIVLIVFRKKIISYKIFSIAALIVLCVGLLVVNIITKGLVTNKISQLIVEPVNSENTMEKTLQGLSDVIVSKDEIKLITDKGTLQFVRDNTSTHILDENDQGVEFYLENDYYVTYSRFNKIKFQIIKQQGLFIYYNDYQLLNITLLPEEGFVCRNNRWMTYRGNNDIKVFKTFINETSGSGRGYIWSRTVPLLKNTILLGHGPDTFPLYFPQYDLLGKLKTYNNTGIFVDKAHNMYLQTAVNTGVISLIALLILFCAYFVSSAKLYFRQELSGAISAAGLACFGAFCGYIVAGFFNDSVVSVAPVFWVLLGTGIGINTKLTMEHQKT